MIDNEFPQRLKALRIARELSMEMLALDLNTKYALRINKGTISRWESGESDPSISYVVKLADYFNVSVDYLIGLTDVQTPARLLAYARRIRDGKYTKEELSLIDDVFDGAKRKGVDT